MLLRAMALAVSVGFALSPAHAEQGAKSSKGKSKRTAQAPKQRYQCKVGPYEKQTRLVLVTVRSKPVYVAYWSSDGPFHCSFETWRGAGRAHWFVSMEGTVNNLISGSMPIERNGDKYLIHARDVDRMPYCGTFGLISGVLTVPLKKGICDWKELPSGSAAGEEAEPDEGTPAASPRAAHHTGSHAEAG
jgi:hypothetical protein